MTRWDLVYKWTDPETQSIVDAVTSALENCDAKLNAALAAPPSEQEPLEFDPKRPCTHGGYEACHDCEQQRRRAASTPVPALDGEALYRAWWSAQWDAGRSTHAQWEQLTPSAQAVWNDAAARLSGDEGADHD